jgi:hypothetical protein
VIGLPAAFLALALGVRHALEPAHLAAIGALVALGGRPRRALALTGVYALAHGLLVTVLGIAALGVGAALGDGALALLERAGGAVLALLGLLAIRAALTGREGHPVGEIAARLGSAGLGGAALFGLLHALGGEGPTQALATAGLASASGAPALLGLFVVGLCATNLTAAALMAGGLALRVPGVVRSALLIGYGLLGLSLGLHTLVG